MRLTDQVLTLARRGVLRPGRPDAVARQLGALRRWGFSLAGEVRQAAGRSPDQVAVIDEDRGAVTYADLVAASDAAARVLLQTVRPGGRLGLLCRNHLGLVEALLGASTAGIDVVLLNTGLSAVQLRAVAADQGLDLVVHDLEFAPALDGVACPTLDEVELLRRMHQHSPVEGGDRATRLTPPDRPGRTVILTSGTTGSPKGARRPHPKGFAALASILDRIPFRVGDRVLLSAPMFHTWGFAGFQLCLGLRATMVLQRRFDPEQARSALRHHGCDAMFAVPVMVQRMLELPDDGLDGLDGLDGSTEGGARRGRLGGDRLRIVALSGSALPSGFSTRFMAAYGPVIHNLYGSTEVSWVAVADPDDLAVDPDCAGRPPRGTRVVIVDESGREIEPGMIGRIFVGNPMPFEGYTNGATKDTWQGLTSTGDLGRWVDGRLHVEGREDDMIVSGGENVYPSELEGAIAAMPEVRETAVFGVPDDRFGQRLVAFVVLNPGATLDGEAVVDRVRPLVARHSLPREVEFVDALPRNATGKVLVRELRDTYAANGT